MSTITTRGTGITITSIWCENNEGAAGRISRPRSRECAASLRRMTNAEIRAARPSRIKTVMVTARDSLNRFAAQMAVPTSRPNASVC